MGMNLLILKGFYYLGDLGNYVYIYRYMYLSILKEAFIIWVVVFGDVFLFIPNLHNVLNKFNITSAAAGLWGINVIDEYFRVRCRVIFGDLQSCTILICAQKNRKTNRQT